MKKLLIIFIYVVSLNANNYELKLYEKILPAIFPKIPIDMLVNGEMLKVLSQSDKFKMNNNCQNIDLIIGKDISNLPSQCQDKPLFATTYKAFKENDNCFGAFYWRKGRPQIKFKLSVLAKYDLYLPSSFRKYAK